MSNASEKLVADTAVVHVKRDVRWKTRIAESKSSLGPRRYCALIAALITCPILASLLNCPKCGAKLTYSHSQGDAHIYRCLKHWGVVLPPSGRVHLDDPNNPATIHEQRLRKATVKFTFQWFLLLIVGVTTIYVLVQNAYEPGATSAATALAFGFAPLVAGVVLSNLWDGRQKIYWALDERIELRVIEDAIQSPIEWVRRTPRQILRRHPHRRLPRSPFAFAHRHAPRVVHGIDAVDPQFNYLHHGLLEGSDVEHAKPAHRR